MEHAFSEHVLMERVPSRGNIVLALIAGLAASIVGAVVWMVISLITGWHVGIIALGIGALVGSSVRVSGRGSHFIFGIIGAVFTLLSCLAGEIGVTLQLATTSALDLYAVLTHVDILAMVEAIISGTSPVMLLIYAVGAFEGYKLSFRK